MHGIVAGVGASRHNGVMYTADGHTTNYADTLITVSPDTKATAAAAPPAGKGSIAERQYAMMYGHDYEWTSDDVIFAVHADRKGIAADEREAARAEFFSKGQPCLRTSPLAKGYGWGIHADADGRVALVAMESRRYATLIDDEATAKRPAMRNSR